MGLVSKKRLYFVIFMFAACATVLVLRLAQLQILEHERYVAQARDEHRSEKKILAHRGTIRDRNGHPMAMTTTTYDVYLRPELSTGQRAKVAQASPPLIGMSAENILAVWAEAKDKRVLLASGISYEQGRRIASRGFLGMDLELRSQRVYPEGNLAPSLLGFVGQEHQGLTGIERDFNREIGGVPGSLIYERDSFGGPIPAGYQELIPPQDGGDIILTIDRYIQRLVEQKLDEAIAEHHASGGTIIVMEPGTGAVLAMASRPTFDLTKLDLKQSVNLDKCRNRAVTDMYEPGSVFKAFTMAAALNENLVNPQTTFNDGGPVVRYGWTIDNWDGAHPGRLTMTELLQRSSNVGAVWVSDLLGPKRFYDYVARFGFGQPTSVGLAGEASGLTRTYDDPGWSPIDLNTNSFGQGISVTPLQLATAFSAIANGGLLMRPMVIKEMYDNGKTRPLEPVVVRRVMSQENSSLLIAMLNAAAEKGESKHAVVPGYHVAGKTGTASISRGAGYIKGSTIASFIGFAPLQDPRFVILVKIDEPQDWPWGSVVASPVFASIAKDVFTYYRMPPEEPALVARAGAQ